MSFCSVSLAILSDNFEYGNSLCANISYSHRIKTGGDIIRTGEYDIPDREQFRKIWARVSAGESSAPPPGGGLEALAENMAEDMMLYRRAAELYPRLRVLFRKTAAMKKRHLSELQAVIFMLTGDTAALEAHAPGAARLPAALFLRARAEAETALAFKLEQGRTDLGTMAAETRAAAAAMQREIRKIMK